MVRCFFTFREMGIRDRNFSVEAPVGSTLEGSFIGYKTVTLKVTNATTYTVSLQDDSQALDEVVVTCLLYTSRCV